MFRLLLQQHAYYIIIVVGVARCAPGARGSRGQQLRGTHRGFARRSHVFYAAPTGDIVRRVSRDQGVCTRTTAV